MAFSSYVCKRGNKTPRRKLKLSKGETKRLVKWIEKEFGAKEIPYHPGEYAFNCPFCDNKENHRDYSFNIEKLAGHCWRGFSPECASGHSLFMLVVLHYNIDFKEAQKFIEESFETRNSVLKIKNKIKDLSNNARVIDHIPDEIRKFTWDMPSSARNILKSDDVACRKALHWILHKRLIPRDIVELIEPRFFEKASTWRWQWYEKRVFFPVKTAGNSAWIAYAISKKIKRKTLNPPGQILSNMLYLYDLYANDKEPIILCEGIFDALRLFLFGFNAVAIFGTNVSQSQIELLNMSKATEVVVCLDSDANVWKQDKKGKWTSKAITLAKTLREYYFNTVSVMNVFEGDPDELSYEQSLRLFRTRISASVSGLAALRRLSKTL